MRPKDYRTEDGGAESEECDDHALYSGLHRQLCAEDLRAYSRVDVARCVDAGMQRRREGS